MDLGEDAARTRFFSHYRRVMGLSGNPGSWGDESYPEPIDRANVLEPSYRGSTRQGAARVDVVVAAGDDAHALRMTLWSLLAKTGRPFHLVLVDQGASPAVGALLGEMVERHPYVARVSDRRGDGRGSAERIGLGAGGGDFAVLLEPGTSVTHGWMDGMVACLDDDPDCAMVGPLIDVGTGLQGFPHTSADPAEAAVHNQLAPWLTPDAVALFARGGAPYRPEVTTLDRTCRMVRRAALASMIDGSGCLSGPGTDDLDLQLCAAGFSLRMAGDSYVSRLARPARLRSPGSAETTETTEPADSATASPSAADSLDPLFDLRAAVGSALLSPAGVADALHKSRPQLLRLAFVMPNMAHGGSGGLHSVYQEAVALRALGIDAVVLANRSYMEHALVAYADASDVFVEYADGDSIERLSRGRDVLVATHFRSVRSVAGVWAVRRDFLPVYYVQDYEPFFTLNVNGGAPDSLEARSSYDAIDGMLRFAKTDWICNAVGRVLSLHVDKIEPGIDETLFNGTEPNLRAEGPVRVLGMVRPRTWRRQPFATLMLLDRLQRDLGDAVEVHSFGCTDEALASMVQGRQHEVRHHGVLTRQQIAARHRETDIFLDISAFQGMGRTAFEGMCCGCAPIVPLVGGAHEYAIDDVNAVMVDTSDLDACYRALRDLVLDRSRLLRLQEAGVAAGGHRSVLAAAISEYAAIDHAFGKQFGLGPPLTLVGTTANGVAS
jgi:glycosyltransferase involved in cell wall biosynthesis